MDLIAKILEAIGVDEKEVQERLNVLRNELYEQAKPEHESFRSVVTEITDTAGRNLEGEEGDSSLMLTVQINQMLRGTRLAERPKKLIYLLATALAEMSIAKREGKLPYDSEGHGCGCGSHAVGEDCDECGPYASCEEVAAQTGVFHFDPAKDNPPETKEE